ncbi:hypothetical protein NIES267_10770 [Calothrix parasitica NIES-267]|uniref:Uncharacterized protein n=1 Tax=Calothrix parasitica NIES-267 TaxID=1973488 RepID=A0A1Z4LK28_9CYAN|nr:hypothetical protein NIES267_10770 [Calothrix parasitica NIES-267]
MTVKKTALSFLYRNAWLNLRASFNMHSYNSDRKAMTNPSTYYWTLIRINAAGNRQVQPIPSAQTFFNQIFAKLIDVSNPNNKDIQLQLLNLYGDASVDKRINAQRCLLCFISWEIEKVCLNLEKQFGATGGFTSRDLLPYVLDDDGRLDSKNSYQCYSLEILNSFDINQSSLSSWTSRKVKQHPSLSKFLLECGIYLLSDWAILNDTQPKQLERILSQFHSLTATEIQQYKWLLQSYHTVYRAQRLQQRKARTSKCQPPSVEQLEQISDKLNNLSQGKYSYEPNNLMSKLQQLSGYLREYRIHVRGGYLAKESIDAADTNISAINNSENEAENQTSEFLKLYRPQFIECLDNALTTVTEARVKKIQRKDAIKAKKFITALELFHCQGLSMTEIAKRIELKAQFQVTRLLKLKELRADITNEVLALLKNRVLYLVKSYASLEKLQALESQITIALTEQVTNLIAEAEIEASASRTNSNRSRFASRLCEYLDLREK